MMITGKPMTEIREIKKQYRLKVKAERKLIEQPEKEELDRAICTRFLSLASYRYSKTVLLYAPLKGEIDVMQIARAAWESGRDVAFPRCDPATRTMTFHPVRGESELSPGSFGILEPAADSPTLDFGSAGTMVCVVPALVYDRAGYRIGYGGGYYDRFLSDYPGAKIGLIYSRFLADRVPHGRFDAASDALITEKGVIIPCQTKK